MAAIEACSERHVIRRPECNEKFLIISNNFTHQDMLEYDGSPEFNWYHSQTRYTTVFNALKYIEKEYSVGYVKKILFGEQGFICQYQRKLRLKPYIYLKMAQRVESFIIKILSIESFIHKMR